MEDNRLFWQRRMTGEIHCRVNLFYALNDYKAYNLYQMIKEESMLNESLWATYTDDEIIGFEQ